VAVLESAAGFLGLSWAGVRATLGRAVRQAEHAMWDAEVVAAIGKAATIIPDHDESGSAAAELADAGMAPAPGLPRLELDARAHDEGLLTGELENLGGIGGDL